VVSETETAASAWNVPRYAESQSFFSRSRGSRWKSWPARAVPSGARASERGFVPTGISSSLARVVALMRETVSLSETSLSHLVPKSVFSLLVLEVTTLMASK